MTEEIHTYLGFILFGLSELMPFIKLWKADGFCDALWCAFCSSQCIKELGDVEPLEVVADTEQPDEWLPPPA